ncbi:Cof-type HAD-IIB family hydrolase [Mycoplasmopsis gallinarum]|uniref:Cof-type HAD-IIB family hydrolase n=1 Tax=Mycoplasmopsis gallinarum TaxID=29557 RepID=UPI000487F59D|nr:Cof-type HAD-IIB family hydrolase [Mycoplasmopsis gallinarum]
MERKIFAFDMDGTLMSKNNQINLFTQEMIIKSQKLGNINVICTGRGLSKVIPLLNELEGFDYLICSNGVAIYDIKNHKIYLTGSIDKKVFDEMFIFANNHNYVLTVDGPEFSGTWLKNNEWPDYVDKNNMMDLSKFYVKSLIEIHNYIDNNNPITQIAIRAPKDNAKKVFDYFNNLYQNEYSVYLTNSIYIDIVPLNTSKWNGLKFLANLFNLNLNNTYTFGDSGNDVEMINNAYFGIAMGNATEDAKKVAKLIIGDHETDTIGKTIQQILDNQF